MINRLQLFAKDTINRFMHFAFKEIITSHQFIIGKQPKENLHSGWDDQRPDRRLIHLRHASEAIFFIDGASGVDPLGVIGPNNGVTVRGQAHTISNLL